MQTSKQPDFIVIGGGTSGCALASRLRQRQQNLSILLIEAGKRLENHPHIYQPAESVFLQGSDIDWNYQTVPQHNLDGKPKYNCAVRGLSGGVAINSGAYVTYSE